MIRNNSEIQFNLSKHQLQEFTLQELYLKNSRLPIIELQHHSIIHEYIS